MLIRPRSRDAVRTTRVAGRSPCGTLPVSMSSRTSTSRGRLRIAYRCASLLLLAFTIVDLSSHGVCGEDWLGLSPAALRVAATSDSGARTAEWLATSDSTDGSTTPAAPDEDCFCCCSHLVVTARYVLAPVTPESASSFRPRFRLPSTPPQSLDRPPRSV